MTTRAKKRESKSNRIIINIVLVMVVIGLVLVPLFISKNAEFAGADDRAEKAITEINTNYKPWFSPIFEPKSGEVETFFFALQAAIGSGIVFYILGYMKGRKKKVEADKL